MAAAALSSPALRSRWDSFRRSQTGIVLELIARRIATAIPTLFGVILVAFVINRVIPGNPARAILGNQVSNAAIEQLDAQLGLTQPLWKQFIQYLGNVARLNFGTAWHTGRPVMTDLATNLPATVELAVAAALLAIVVGIPLGVIQAVYRGRPADLILRITALLGISLPSFWFGIELVQVFYVSLGIAPAPSGQISTTLNPPTHITGLYIIDALLSGDMLSLESTLAHLVLPAICLGVAPLAVISRMTRSAMIEVLDQDYIRTAQAKGVGSWRLILSHAFKNAAPTIVTVVGIQMGYLMSGAVVIEAVFAWPGIGSYLYNSILASDYAPVQAVMVLTAVIFIAINLVADILHVLIDPKVRNV